ncbi:MAG: hypothetical protein GY847_25200 [Proteobacteria bacterium]|nr:hypothetical protein [Pseudomonadota bacterium]
MTNANNTPLKFKKTNSVEGSEGCYEWHAENVRIYRTGGTDRSGHFTWNLGTYAVEINGKDVVRTIQTLKAAKEVATYYATK